MSFIYLFMLKKDLISSWPVETGGNIQDLEKTLSPFSGAIQTSTTVCVKIRHRHMFRAAANLISLTFMYLGQLEGKLKTAFARVTV